jgi:hypothetical protein
MGTASPVKKEPVITHRKRKAGATFIGIIPKGGIEIDDLETIRANSWGKSVKSVRKKAK